MWRKSEEMILNRAWLMRRQMIVVRHFGTQICNFHLAMGFMLGFQFLCLIWSVLSLGKSFFLFHFPGLLWLGIGQQLPADAAPVCMIIVPMYHAAPETLAHCSHVLFNWDLMMVNTIQLWYRPDTINIFIQCSCCDTRRPRNLRVSCNKDCTGFDSRTPAKWHRVTMSQCLSRQIISNI